MSRNAAVRQPVYPLPLAVCVAIVGVLSTAPPGAYGQTLSASIPATLANGPTGGPLTFSMNDAFTLRFFDVDDVLSAYITNSEFTNQLILRSSFGEVTTDVEFSDFVRSGVNTIHLELINTSPGQGWTYGYDFKVNGKSQDFDQCGTFNRVGCQNDESQGVVWTHDIEFTVVDTPRLPQLDWVKQAGGPGMDFPRDIAVDRRGHSYVTGEFRDVATFGPGEANETTLTALNPHDVFVAEYSRPGKLVWVSQVSGPGNLGLYGIAVDPAGRAAITGLFDGSVTFAPGGSHETTLTGHGGFLARYDEHGDLLWAVRGGLGGKLAVDSAGTSYVVGGGTFESTDGTVLTLTGTPGVATTFVVKYNLRGEPQLAARAEDGGPLRTRSIAVDGNGNIYLGQLTSNGTSVARYAADGRLRWKRQIVQAAGSSADGYDIAVDQAGNSYVVGWFSTAVTFALGEENETTLRAAFGRGSFLAKYDRSGGFMWAKHIEAGPSCGPDAVAVDSRGSSYVTGAFCGAASVTFGRGERNETTLVPMANVGGGERYVAKFDIHGALAWATLGGGTGIVVDDPGNMYVSGLFPGGPTGSSPVTFGLGQPNETTLVSAGSSDVFVTKHSHARDHRNVTSSPVVEDLIAVSDVRATFPRSSRAVITATFTNVSSSFIKYPYFAVSEITDGAVLINGDGSPLGVHATLAPDVGDGVLAPGEAIRARFVIRLDNRDVLRFFVNVRGNASY
jgi:hypothetical protein